MTKRSFPLRDSYFKGNSDIIKFLGVGTKRKTYLYFSHFLVIMFLLHQILIYFLNHLLFIIVHCVWN